MEYDFLSQLLFEFQPAVADANSWQDSQGFSFSCLFTCERCKGGSSSLEEEVSLRSNSQEHKKVYCRFLFWLAPTNKRLLMVLRGRCFVWNGAILLMWLIFLLMFLIPSCIIVKIFIHFLALNNVFSPLLFVFLILYHVELPDAVVLLSIIFYVQLHFFSVFHIHLPVPFFPFNTVC